MLKPGDFIYNVHLDKPFEIVEVIFCWDRTDTGGSTPIKKPYKSLYRKWYYKVQPAEEIWWEEKEGLVTGTWWRKVEYNDRASYNKPWHLPNYLYTVDLSLINPGEFEAHGFRLLTKKQRKVIQVLYGKRKVNE